MGSLGSCIEGIGLLNWVKLIRNKMASSYIYVLSILFVAASVSADATKCYKGGPEVAPFVGTVKDSACGTDEKLCYIKVTNSTKMVEFKCIASVSGLTAPDDGSIKCTTSGDHECICKKDNCNAPESACIPQKDVLKCYQGHNAANATKSMDCPNKCYDRCGKETSKDKVAKTMCLLSTGLPTNYKDVTGEEKSKCEKASDVEYCVYKDAGGNMPSSSTALESMMFSMIASTLLVKVVVY